MHDCRIDTMAQQMFLRRLEDKGDIEARGEGDGRVSDGDDFVWSQN